MRSFIIALLFKGSNLIVEILIEIENRLRRIGLERIEVEDLLVLTGVGLSGLCLLTQGRGKNTFKLTVALVLVLINLTSGTLCALSIS